MNSYYDQFFLLYILGFFVYYLLLDGSVLLMSFISVKLLGKTILKHVSIKKYVIRLFGYSILSLVIALIIISIIANIFEWSVFGGVYVFFTSFLGLVAMPSTSMPGSELFVLSLIGISFLFNLIFDFLLVFRKIELSIMKKFLCALISAAMVSPYALLISFDGFLV